MQPETLNTQCCRKTLLMWTSAATISACSLRSATHTLVQRHSSKLMPWGPLPICAVYLYSWRCCRRGQAAFSTDQGQPKQCRILTGLLLVQDTGGLVVMEWKLCFFVAERRIGPPYVSAESHNAVPTSAPVLGVMAHLSRTGIESASGFRHELQVNYCWGVERDARV